MPAIRLGHKMEEPTLRKQTYPRWIGVLLGFLLPGSAHFLFGLKSAGIKWLLAFLLLSIVAQGVVAIPIAGAVATGILLIFLLTPALFIAMLCKSYKPIPRLRPGGWLAFILSLVSIYILSISVRGIIATPYRVPTGAMQSTIRGTTTGESTEATSWIDWIIEGRRHTVFQALEPGKTENMQMNPEGVVYTIGGTQHHLPGYVLQSFRPKVFYNKGDVLWEGTVFAGDQIMVEKTTYWFRPPRKGDIVVFSTENIAHQHVRNDTFYIKRIAAAPGDTIRIQPPHILINNEPLEAPEVFKRFAFDNAGQLASSTNSVMLGENEFFVLGDNTAPGMSLDSRYFGSIEKESIVGRVSTIYWPFTRMGGVE